MFADCEVFKYSFCGNSTISREMLRTFHFDKLCFADSVLVDQIDVLAIFLLFFPPLSVSLHLFLGVCVCVCS